MQDPFDKLAKKLRPDLEGLPPERRIGATGDVITLLYMLPIMVLGLYWLAASSDWAWVKQAWGLYLCLGGLLILFNRMSFFLITEIRAAGYANTEGGLDGIVNWAAVLLFGPVGLWLDVLWNLFSFVKEIRKPSSLAVRWNRSRTFVATTGGNLVATLIALQVYLGLGGTLPLQILGAEIILPVMAAILVQFLVYLGLYSGYMVYVTWAIKQQLGSPIRPLMIFFLLSLALPAFGNPFGALAAGIYIQSGFLVFLWVMAGLLLVAYLTRQLSNAAERDRQQSRLLNELERLGRAILSAPPDGSALPELLKKHVPGMFPTRGVLIWMGDGQVLLRHPEDWNVPIEPIWAWLNAQDSGQAFSPGESLPWQRGGSAHTGLMAAPILDFDSQRPIGGIYLELQGLVMPWGKRGLANLLLAVGSLCDQVTSALHQAHTYAESLAMQRTRQELDLARGIQASFLPEALPSMSGWQITAVLEPARQIAGDFYDFIPLSDGSLAVLIADVADKGLGPALYMALCRTLLRTFTGQYPGIPARVMAASNQRILQDARANLFVTVFYAILEPDSGRLTYCNAGHPPPWLFSQEDGRMPVRLSNTGMPLGIDERAEWQEETIQIRPGDHLLLYTDGVMDAQNELGEFVDRQLVMQSVQACLEHGPASVEEAILSVVHNFVGEAPRFDDITLVIIGREA